MNDPYCLFLLDTSSVKSHNQSASSGKLPTQKSIGSEDRVLDYKLFLNTAIKEKILNFERPFCDESFIVDHFWRAKFP